MGPPGTGTLGSCPLQGASAIWGCVRVPPTLRLGFSALRLGRVGLAWHECFYTQVRTPRWFPPGRYGLTLKPVLALSALRPSGREPAPSGLASPRPPGAVAIRRPPGSAGGAGGDSRSKLGPDVRREDGADQARLGAGGAAPAVPRGWGVGEFAHSHSSAGPLLSSGSARGPGLAPLPPPFGSSFPLPTALAGAAPHTSVLEPNQAGSPFMPGR